MATDKPIQGPDLSLGISLADIPDGGLLGGHVGDKPVALARRGDEVFAIGGGCSHYGGPLAEGLLVNDTVRCPWHHACFSIHTGDAVAAPAFNSVGSWIVERDGDRVRVTAERPAARPIARVASRIGHPRSVVIIGGGAAGYAAADTLRKEGYGGALTIVSADDAPPCDRPNLSKDYLAGSAPEDWIPLRPPDFYRERNIELVLGTRVTEVDTAGRRVILDGGTNVAYDALLLATGASPVRLPESVDPGKRARYLRTLADSRALIEASERARCAVVLGASFIGLEVAASLRGRGLDVHVAAPEAKPLERIVGAELSDLVRKTHENGGVKFHLGHTARSVDAGGVVLDDGTRIDAEVVVAGIGVRPDDDLARRAGIAVDRGVVVNAMLETSVAAVFAAGDVARYPDPVTGKLIRIEHWVVAERQGQTAARNMLGADERFTSVPFFWSRHFDLSISYSGHAEKWDVASVAGDAAAGDCAVTYLLGGQVLAVATVGRDRESLVAEAHLESIYGSETDPRLVGQP